MLRLVRLLVRLKSQEVICYVCITAQRISLGFADIWFARRSIASPDRERPLLSLRADELGRAGCNGLDWRLLSAWTRSYLVRELLAEDTTAQEPCHGKPIFNIVRYTHSCASICTSKAAVVKTMNLLCSRVTFTLQKWTKRWFVLSRKDMVSSPLNNILI